MDLLKVGQRTAVAIVYGRGTIVFGTIRSLEPDACPDAYVDNKHNKPAAKPGITYTDGRNTFWAYLDQIRGIQ